MVGIRLPGETHSRRYIYIYIHEDVYRRISRIQAGSYDGGSAPKATCTPKGITPLCQGPLLADVFGLETKERVGMYCVPNPMVAVSCHDCSQTNNHAVGDRWVGCMKD